MSGKQRENERPVLIKPEPSAVSTPNVNRSRKRPFKIKVVTSTEPPSTAASTTDSMTTTISTTTTEVLIETETMSADIVVTTEAVQNAVQTTKPVEISTPSISDIVDMVKTHLDDAKKRYVGIF